MMGDSNCIGIPAAIRVEAHLRTCDLRRTREETVAQALGISPTTMRRRLRSNGTSYQKLLNAELRRRALELLERNPHADTWKLADVLGYSERNTAARTFTRLFGMGIREWRARA